MSSAISPTPARPIPTNCQRCGVCCFSESDEYVWVTGYDWERLGPEAELVAQFIGNRAFMRMTGGHCAALQIQAAADGGKTYFCSLYDRRPEICRALERGSPECEADLELKSDAVQQRPTASP
ncbi:MAG: YkgJ family cysteine cluster protein [Opitutus sp.]